VNDLTGAAQDSTRQATAIRGYAGRVLVVDDVEGNVRLAASVLEPDGYIVSSASNGRAALAAIERNPPDLILLDVMMPDLDGFETCRLLKSRGATRLIPIVLVTALRDPSDRIRGIDAGADDFISKPFNPHELRARVRSLVRIKRYTDDLESADAMILSLAMTIEARDLMTDGHCQRLAAYANALGARIGLPENDLGALRRGGFLHDIGKIGIPDAILMKAGPLTADEYALMQTHTVIGDRLCGELRSLRAVRPIVRSHHERLDGSGYPDHLRGDAIPLLAHIMGIVDVFDAITTDRPYRRAATATQACEELVREAKRGKHGVDLVSAFVGLVEGGELPAFEHAHATTEGRKR
jgi:putative two-component system response regulator